MPIQLRTGLPGAGKTLGAVERLMEMQEKYPDRPRFVIGITDLREGLATVIDADQLREWETFPAGSIIFVDECQKYMPSRRAGDPPKWIKDLSTHRHLGLDFVLITQHPALIDTYVRRLVDSHIHTIRKYGTSYVERWEFGECVAEPSNKATQKTSNSKTLVKFNPKAMEAYTSAELHTVERRIPRFIYVGIALVVVIPVLIFITLHVMNRLSHRESAEPDALKPAASSAPVATSHGSSAGREKPMTRDEWVARFQPRVSGMPWSAPAYDDRKVEGTPELYCIIMGVGEPDEHCRCNTEQGTRATVPDSMCKTMARDGTYNPYRKPPREEDRLQGRQPGADPQPVDVVSAVRPTVTQTMQPGRSADTPASIAARVGTHYLPPEQTVVSSSF